MFEAEQWKILDVHASLNRFQLNSTWTFSSVRLQLQSVHSLERFIRQPSSSIVLKRNRKLWLSHFNYILSSNRSFNRSFSSQWGQSSVTGFSGLIFNRSFEKFGNIERRQNFNSQIVTRLPNRPRSNNYLCTNFFCHVCRFQPGEYFFLASNFKSSPDVSSVRIIRDEIE